MNDEVFDEIESDDDGEAKETAIIGDVTMNNEMFDEIESDDDEETEATVFSDTLYIPLGKPKSLKEIPLAFTVPDNIEPVTVKGLTIAWTKAALHELSTIQKAACKGDPTIKNLPYASLRGLLEVGLDNLARMQSNVGLSKYSLNPKTVNESEPSPNPLEIVVTLRQENDKPDRLAALVESLRYGFGHYSDWSSLPAPLFFERVVRDYISDFAIFEDEETEGE